MEFINVGKILTTHGIKGELKVKPNRDDFLDFEEVDILYIGSKKIKTSIKQIRQHKNALLIQFNEYDNINDVLKYKDSYVYIEKSDLRDLEEDEYYIEDLLGFQVIDMEDEKIGYLKDIQIGNSNDIYVVENEERNKEYLIPGVKEFIKSINLQEKCIKISPIEGMIE